METGRTKSNIAVARQGQELGAYSLWKQRLSGVNKRCRLVAGSGRASAVWVPGLLSTQPTIFAWLPLSHWEKRHCKRCR